MITLDLPSASAALASCPTGERALDGEILQREHGDLLIGRLGATPLRRLQCVGGTSSAVLSPDCRASVPAKPRGVMRQAYASVQAMRCTSWLWPALPVVGALIGSALASAGTVLIINDIDDNGNATPASLAKGRVAILLCAIVNIFCGAYLGERVNALVLLGIERYRGQRRSVDPGQPDVRAHLARLPKESVAPPRAAAPTTLGMATPLLPKGVAAGGVTGTGAAFLGRLRYLFGGLSFLALCLSDTASDAALILTTYATAAAAAENQYFVSVTVELPTSCAFAGQRDQPPSSDWYIDQFTRPEILPACTHGLNFSTAQVHVLHTRGALPSGDVLAGRVPGNDLDAAFSKFAGTPFEETAAVDASGISSSTTMSTASGDQTTCASVQEGSCQQSDLTLPFPADGPDVPRSVSFRQWHPSTVDRPVTVRAATRSSWLEASLRNHSSAGAAGPGTMIFLVDLEPTVRAAVAASGFVIDVSGGGLGGSTIMCYSRSIGVPKSQNVVFDFAADAYAKFAGIGWPLGDLEDHLPIELDNTVSSFPVSPAAAADWAGSEPPELGIAFKADAAGSVVDVQTTYLCAPEGILAQGSSFPPYNSPNPVREVLRADLGFSTVTLLGVPLKSGQAGAPDLGTTTLLVLAGPMALMGALEFVIALALSPFGAVLFILALQEAVGLVVAVWVAWSLCKPAGDRGKATSKEPDNDGANTAPLHPQSLAYPAGNDNRHLLVTVFARRSLLVAAIVLAFTLGLRSCRCCRRRSADPDGTSGPSTSLRSRLRALGFFTKVERARQLYAFRSERCGAAPRQGLPGYPYPLRFLLGAHLYLDLFQAVFSGALALSDESTFSIISLTLSVQTILRIITVDIRVMFNHRFCYGGCLCSCWFAYHASRLLCCREGDGCCSKQRVAARLGRYSRRRRRCDLQRRDALLAREENRLAEEMGGDDGPAL